MGDAKERPRFARHRSRRVGDAKKYGWHPDCTELVRLPLWPCRPHLSASHARARLGKLLKLAFGLSRTGEVAAVALPTPFECQPRSRETWKVAETGIRAVENW